MPLTLANVGEPSTIKKVGGNEKTRQFLAGLGFNEGSSVTVVSSIDGNVIVQVKESRIAISREMAMKISV